MNVLKINIYKVPYGEKCLNTTHRNDYQPVVVAIFVAMVLISVQRYTCLQDVECGLESWYAQILF